MQAGRAVGTRQHQPSRCSGTPVSCRRVPTNAPVDKRTKSISWIVGHSENIWHPSCWILIQQSGCSFATVASQGQQHLSGFLPPKQYVMPFVKSNQWNQTEVPASYIV